MEKAGQDTGVKFIIPLRGQGDGSSVRGLSRTRGRFFCPTGFRQGTVLLADVSPDGLTVIFSPKHVLMQGVMAWFRNPDSGRVVLAPEKTAPWNLGQKNRPLVRLG